MDGGWTLIGLAYYALLGRKAVDDLDPLSKELIPNSSYCVQGAVLDCEEANKDLHLHSTYRQMILTQSVHLHTLDRPPAL